MHVVRGCAGNYPSKFTIVSYDFKRPRFVGLHARALGISEEQLTFLGTPAVDEEGAAKVRNNPVAWVRPQQFNAIALNCWGRLFESR